MLILLPLVLRNVTRNLRRTILTIFSIAVSIFIFAALTSMPSLVNQILRERANSQRVVVYNKSGYFYPLPSAYARRIESMKHVGRVIGESIFLATYRNPNDQVPAVAADPEHFAEVFDDWGIAADAASAFLDERTGALVGHTLMSRFGWKVGDLVMLHGLNAPIDIQLKVVGELNTDSARFVIVFRHDYLDEALGHRGTADIFWVKVDRSQNIPQVIRDIDETFANAAFETKTESEIAAMENRVTQMRILIDGAKFLASIVVLAIGLVAFNTAAMSARERRREMAVMRSLGFTRAAVVAMAIAEGLILGLAGGALGCTAAWAGLKLLPHASRSIGMLAYAIAMPSRSIAYGILIAAAIGALSAFIPAAAISRGNISSALRAV
ncbi:MAG: ABC transporter permease [Deltaproteobacteria bacterium]|nr:ABC transporter permease [Deltaproteobacteria bacterium]